MTVNVVTLPVAKAGLNTKTSFIELKASAAIFSVLFNEEEKKIAPFLTIPSPKLKMSNFPESLMIANSGVTIRSFAFLLKTTMVLWWSFSESSIIPSDLVLVKSNG